jgi:hypothetical protein
VRPDAREKGEHPTVQDAHHGAGELLDLRLVELIRHDTLAFR